MNGDFCPFLAAEGRHDTWVVTDGFHNLLDSIPTLTAAENIAGEMNRAWQRGYAAAQGDIRNAIGVLQR
jgi:hypothetical protein